MTSNIGARDLKDFGAGIGFATQAKKENMDDIMKSTIQNALKKTFSPEFLNRLDDVIIFNSLEKEDIFKIIDINLKKLFARIEAMGYGIELTDKAKDYLSDKGYDPQFGARPLARAIQKHLEDPIAEEILKSDIEEGDVLVADWDGKKEDLTLKVKKKKSSSKASDKK